MREKTIFRQALNIVYIMLFLHNTMYSLANAKAVPRPNQAGHDGDVVSLLGEKPERLRFHLGDVEAGRPKIDASLPNMPGDASSWYVAQWQHREYLHASDLLVDRTVEGDRRRPAYVFGTPDRQTRLVIRRKPAGSGYVYNLLERGGHLTEGGGSNLFLAAPVISDTATFDRPVTLSIDTRVTAARVSYDVPTARADGAVLAMAFIGLGVMYRDPVDGRQQFVFMQIPLTASREPTRAAGVMCSLNQGKPQLLYSTAAGDRAKFLPFRPDTGGLHTLRHDVSALVAGMLAQPYPCGGRTFTWSTEERRLERWRLTGLYVGLEVQDTDDRKLAIRHDRQGTAELGLDIGRLSVTRAGP